MIEKSDDSQITKTKDGNLQIYDQVIYGCRPEFVTQEEILLLKEKIDAYEKARQEVERTQHEFISTECMIRENVGQRMFENRKITHKNLAKELVSLSS